MFRYAVLVSQLTGFGKVLQQLYVQFEVSFMRSTRQDHP